MAKSWKDELNLINDSKETERSLSNPEDLEYEPVDELELPAEYNDDNDVQIKIDTLAKKLDHIIDLHATVKRAGDRVSVELKVIPGECADYPHAKNLIINDVMNYIHNEVNVGKFDFIARSNTWLNHFLKEISDQMTSNERWKNKIETMLNGLNDEYDIIPKVCYEDRDKSIANVYTEVLREIVDDMCIDVSKSLARFLVLKPLDFYVFKSTDSLACDTLFKSDSELYKAVEKEFGHLPKWLLK